jgi:hypothetical protein
MKALRNFSLLILLIPIIVSAQTRVDAFLVNNGDEWHIKTKVSIFGNPPKTKFGPFETTGVKKGKLEKIDRQKETSLEGVGSGEPAGFVANITTTYHRPDKLTVLFNNTDSIFIDMLMQVVVEDKRSTILFGKQDQPYESNSTTYWNETYIKTKSYTTPWHMLAVGNLTNTEKADSIEIQRVSGFKIGKQKKEDLFGITTGFALLQDGIQAAAIQTDPEINVWIRKDLSDEYKQILGGVIIAIVAGKSR